MSNTKLVHVETLDLKVEIFTNSEGGIHYWLKGEEYSTPLSKINDSDYGSYCYFEHTTDGNLKETRVYQDGTIVTN